ncbi:hypothetical protein HPP92_016005 [Vanilla planifolia]|uniref:Uncharacterized protein n=1 Tax=Vanilla planifolia TaxID=51239 RepID=A0A835QM88_VANPL|nr:hypothetical protein HPP92_016005 [Vanilla planifolia]
MDAVSFHDVDFGLDPEEYVRTAAFTYARQCCVMKTPMAASRWGSRWRRSTWKALRSCSMDWYLHRKLAMLWLMEINDPYVLWVCIFNGFLRTLLTAFRGTVFSVSLDSDIGSALTGSQSTGGVHSP